MRRQFIVAGLFAPVAAFAASLAEAPVETIIVTAYRTPQALDRVGSAVSIVSRDNIDVRQNALAADALRSVPGLAIARTGPIGSQTQIRMRGAEANQVLVLIDGVEANDLATSDEFSFEHLTTFDIERIEVVRGPQSALWGSDALAGVINVVTRRPEQPFETEGYLEGGSFGTWNGGAQIGGRTDRFSLVASASRFDTDGTNASESGVEDDGYDNTTVNLAGSFRLLSNLMLDSSFRSTDATAAFDANDYVNGALVAVDADNETDVEQVYFRTGGRLALFDGRWSQALHYSITGTDTDTTAEESFDDGNPADGGFDRSSTNGDKYGIYYQSTVRVSPGTAESPGNLLTLAVEHEREKFSQRGEPSFFGDPNQDQGLHTTGYAIEYIAFIGRDVSVSASARHDNNSDFGNVNTWRTTASWNLPAAGSRLHGSFGTGQKAPTFFERFGFTPDTFNGNPDLEPETSQGWDAGLEQRWLAGRLVADVTYFRADLDNEINGFFCPPPLPPYFECTPTAVNEDGKSHRKGVEATVEAEFTPTYSVSASYTYTDAKQSDVQPDGSDPGIIEVRRPRHAASLNLTGRWLNGRLTVNAGGYYTGDRADDSFLLDPPFVQRVTLDAYTLVNIAASYELSREVTVYARLENALDEDYQNVYGYNTPGVGGFFGVRVGLSR